MNGKNEKNKKNNSCIYVSSSSRNAPWFFMCVYSEEREANERERERVFESKFLLKKNKERRKHRDFRAKSEQKNSKKRRKKAEKRDQNTSTNS